MTHTTDTTRRVRITTTTAGQNFATVGVIKALNGRAIAWTEPRPYGATAAAMRAARTLAERRGWTVID